MTFTAARHDRSGGSFEDFEQKYGVDVASDVLQSVCEAAYAERGRKQHTENGVSITDIHKHNAINMTFSGTVVMSDGVEYGFVIDDGDWDGTKVREWGLSEDVEPYEPPRPDPSRLIPKRAEELRRNAPAKWKVYLAWRKESWFTELERQCNYDRFFAPGIITRDHYNAEAAKRGLTWDLESRVEEFIARPDSDFPSTPSAAELEAGWNAFSS